MPIDGQPCCATRCFECLAASGPRNSKQTVKTDTCERNQPYADTKPFQSLYLRAHFGQDFIAVIFLYIRVHEMQSPAIRRVEDKLRQIGDGETSTSRHDSEKQPIATKQTRANMFFLPKKGPPRAQKPSNIVEWKYFSQESQKMFLRFCDN